MTLDEALEQAVLGEKVRAVDMPHGVYIDYHFAGFRINFPTGSSSGYMIKEHDERIKWEIYEPPVANVGWGSYQPPAQVFYAEKREKSEAPKRGRPRKDAWQPPAVIDDVPLKTEAKPAGTGWAVFNK